MLRRSRSSFRLSRLLAAAVAVSAMALGLAAVDPSSAAPAPDVPAPAPQDPGGASVPLTPASMTGVVPARLLDTRGGATIDGAFQGGGALGPQEARSLVVTGRGGVPPSGVGAVVLNVTATQPTASTFVTVYPTGQSRPGTSTVNFAAGQTVANVVIARVGTGGRVELYNAAGSTHLLVDVTGWFPTSDPFTSLTPARLLDTRGGATVDGQGVGGGPLGPGGTTSVTVTGRGGVPTSGVGAVVVNITVTAPSPGGFVVVWPSGQPRPSTSNINFGGAQTVANLAIVRVGTGGRIDLYNDAGTAHVLVDVVGWFDDGSSYGALTPARLMDTRGGLTVDGQFRGAGPVGARRTTALTVTGRGGVPPSGVGAVVVNVTVTAPTSGGFVTVYPDGQARPTTSNVNLVPQRTTANLVVAPVGVDGRIRLYNDAGSSGFVVDVMGWIPGTPLPPSAALGAVSLHHEAVAVVASPSDLAARPGSSLLFVAQRGGTVRRIDPVTGSVSPPVLDLTADLSTQGERGLLGLAFSPDGARLYVSFNTADGTSAIDEFTMAGDDVVLASRRPVLRVAQPAATNHKGGDLAFGPDGFLYWALGDGGGSGDPFGNGQRLTTLLGGLVRIDPSGRANGAYSVPPDNPWAGGGGAPEKWAAGMRNPWRFSFDRTTGDLWVADVGQNAWEEVTFLPAPGRGGGANLGWPHREGAHDFLGGAPPGVVEPLVEYGHGTGRANGCSITGGFVYRGAAIPELQGAYLFSDFCVSTLRGARRVGGGLDTPGFDTVLPSGVVSFGEDNAGELYTLSFGSGAIGRIVRS
jgi:glucose/arabinose dehydrogenase